MVMHRGEIWWATLRRPQGSEPGYRRPVLIVQSDEFNSSSINTVVVVALTSNLRLQAAPGNVPLSRRAGKLPRDSVANVSQIITLDKSFLTERISRLDAEKMTEIENGLRLVLNI
ncbi:MAG: type II toxin-antitoxin system PemK/MazF family toxin [Candidatus Aureabacteria bacterium]|nr:type II toxin-antitoxin system PemK/MazF family toxin [Candidatus Auribacterota bacterium]